MQTSSEIIDTFRSFGKLSGNCTLDSELDHYFQKRRLIILVRNKKQNLRNLRNIFLKKKGRTR